MIFRSFTSLLLLLLFSLLIILETDLGLALLIRVIPGEASAQKISGSLLHGFSMEGFNYRNESIEISTENIYAHWQWHELLKQNFVINSIQVENVTIKFFETSKKSSTLKLSPISIPINIYLDALNIKNIKISDKSNVYLFNQISLNGELVNNTLKLNEVSILTPTLSSTINGIINLKSWSNIKFNNQITVLSRQNLPIFTTITGNKNAISLHITSIKWLDISLVLEKYLETIEDITIQANWFVDTEKAAFPELKKLNGMIQITGRANGNLLHPIIQGKLAAKNIVYDTLIIKNLNSLINVDLKNKQKMDFHLAGRNISLGETVLNNIHASLTGTLKSHVIKISLQTFNSDFFSLITQAGVMNENTYSISQGKIDIGPLNLSLSPIEMKISLKNDKVLSYQATFQHEKEILSLQGNSELSFPDLKTQLSVFTKQFSVINTKPYKVALSSDLQINHNESITKISGNLEVLSANIAPTDFSNTVTLTSDIIYTNNKGEPLYKKSSPLQLFIDVFVTIKKITLDYKGVNAAITGETKLTQTPTTELSAYGQLQFLYGSYKAYGQALTIQKGSTLNFIHDLDNPQLNITASKHIPVSAAYMTLPSYQPYLIAGVEVTGTADEPIIRLFTIPGDVSQQDILSYLIFGFPQSQLSRSQASALYSAFNMMDISNGNFSLTALQKNIQQEFGFSEFGIGNTSEYNSSTQQYETGTAFVVGKRITDNLTATYNVGILVPVNVFYLRYQLAQHWALQSDSSALGNGGDIFYTISRD